MYFFLLTFTLAKSIIFSTIDWSLTVFPSGLTISNLGVPPETTAEKLFNESSTKTC